MVNYVVILTNELFARGESSNHVSIKPLQSLPCGFRVNLILWSWIYMQRVHKIKQVNTYP